MSVRIPLEKISNTRDLGGMKTADGRKIRSGLLYRSGFLEHASAADVEKLSGLGISLIIDFRSSDEVLEQPDPQIGEAAFIHLPAEDEVLLGIERDKKSEKRFSEILIDRVVADPGYSVRYMRDMYRRFVSNSYTISQYRKFIRFLEESKGPVLWHCMAGKDRAGFAAVLIEEILGVDRNEIIRDYLVTNEYIKDEVDFLVGMFRKMYAAKEQKEYPEKEVRLFFSTEPEFIGAMYKEAEERYGTFENYLKEALGVDESRKARLQEKYLE